MPIIEPHDPESSLDQGDLLRDVNLFFTAKTDALSGGEGVIWLVRRFQGEFNEVASPTARDSR